jgi:lipooligosaccharide transport system ATP-binding protein
MTDRPTLLEARGLMKHLDGRPVVNGVDLVCRAGQVLGRPGPNGAGKTTTLRMLYGFLGADAGVIRFDGMDAARDVVRFKRQLLVCTQEDTFDGDFTVRENRVIAASHFRPRPPDVQRRVDELLERFRLTPYAGAKPETLSGGFRRRLMIARARCSGRRCSRRATWRSSRSPSRSARRSASSISSSASCPPSSPSSS